MGCNDPEGRTGYAPAATIRDAFPTQSGRFRRRPCPYRRLPALSALPPAALSAVPPAGLVRGAARRPCS
ncbi:hypothetical protein Areg01_79630 [Actinoplanes regularis]|nr:hypothetical protein Areg01_79630 [Actinoplanes regularis]